MGRKMLWPDKILTPLPKGTLARIEATLAPEETKTDFLRFAVEAELRRRGAGGVPLALPAPVRGDKEADKAA